MTETALSSSPRTIHLLQDENVAGVPGFVRVWCGRLGLPVTVHPSMWRHCRACKTAEEADTARILGWEPQRPVTTTTSELL